eukprot:COSAG05_NODE_410_length_10109_cov_29.470430_2_plen_202_part_00
MQRVGAVLGAAEGAIEIDKHRQSWSRSLRAAAGCCDESGCQSMSQSLDIAAIATQHLALTTSMTTLTPETAPAVRAECCRWALAWAERTYACSAGAGFTRAADTLPQPYLAPYTVAAGASVYTLLEPRQSSSSSSTAPPPSTIIRDGCRFESALKLAIGFACLFQKQIGVAFIYGSCTVAAATTMTTTIESGSVRADPTWS